MLYKDNYFFSTDFVFSNFFVRLTFVFYFLNNDFFNQIPHFQN